MYEYKKDAGSDDNLMPIKMLFLNTMIADLNKCINKK